MFKKGKKERNELYLPALRYIVTDDWIEKLGHDAFVAWLKMHTWVDRRDENREHDRVPYTLEDTWKKLGMGKKKFYEKIIRPLWNYCLIDVVEYEASTRKTQKPKNIIVYESPMNLHETEIKPLVKLRDYDMEYGSASQIYGRKGGRPYEGSTNGFQTETVKDTDGLHGFQMETVGSDGFQTETVDGFQMETVTVSKQKPNNVLNNLLITSNKSSNVSNNHHLDDIQQAQKEISSTQEQDMVVDIKLDVFNSFQIELSNQEVIRLIKYAAKHKKNLPEVIQQTKKHFLSTNKPINDLMASFMHGITNGWSKPRKAVVKKPMPKVMVGKITQDFTDEELQGTYADIEATFKKLRSTENQVNNKSF
jgi:hypothetical protein